MALCVITTPSVKAEEVPEAEEVCFLAEKVARITMELRQSDVPLAEVLKSLGYESRAMALVAYESPLFMSDAGKGREINKFANDVLLGCMTIIKSKV